MDEEREDHYKCTLQKVLRYVLATTQRRGQGLAFTYLVKSN